MNLYKEPSRSEIVAVKLRILVQFSHTRSSILFFNVLLHNRFGSPTLQEMK